MSWGSVLTGMTGSANLHAALTAAVSALQLLGKWRQRLFRHQRCQVDLRQLEGTCVQYTQSLTCCALLRIWSTCAHITDEACSGHESAFDCCNICNTHRLTTQLTIYSVTEPTRQ